MPSAEHESPVALAKLDPGLLAIRLRILACLDVSQLDIRLDRALTASTAEDVVTADTPPELTLR